MREVIEIQRCKGHCCRAFTLGYTPEQLQSKFQEEIRQMRRAMKFYKDRRKLIKDYLDRDIYKVYHMVEYIGSFAFDVSGNLLREEVQWYTCKHFNKETGDCMNYERRPEMCKGFPYWGHYSSDRMVSCPYRECEMKVKILELETPEIEGPAVKSGMLK
ncbi:MAG TPA: YkgJ family cysteine cluster protein [Ignavibacteriales bacterium]|nr:YkgJ family cysteine cluster protein [Ignavibacteriales bacterium]